MTQKINLKNYCIKKHGRAKSDEAETACEHGLSSYSTLKFPTERGKGTFAFASVLRIESTHSFGKQQVFVYYATNTQCNRRMCGPRAAEFGFFFFFGLAPVLSD